MFYPLKIDKPRLQQGVALQAANGFTIVTYKQCSHKT